MLASEESAGFNSLNVHFWDAGLISVRGLSSFGTLAPEESTGFHFPSGAVFGFIWVTYAMPRLVSQVQLIHPSIAASNFATMLSVTSCAANKRRPYHAHKPMKQVMKVKLPKSMRSKAMTARRSQHRIGSVAIATVYAQHVGNAVADAHAIQQRHVLTV